MQPTPVSQPDPAGPAAPLAEVAGEPGEPAELFRTWSGPYTYVDHGGVLNHPAFPNNPVRCTFCTHPALDHTPECPAA